jgi:hypothetical protein
MPNVTFRGATDLDRVFKDFVPGAESFEHFGDRIVIKQVGAWNRPGENAWLVETVVRDGPLTQHIGVLVADQNGEKVTVKLASMGFPRTTIGSKRAVGKVAEWIAERAPTLVEIAAPI